MTIRTGRLHKPCAMCGRYFRPSTRYVKLCDKCFLIKRQQSKAKTKITKCL